MLYSVINAVGKILLDFIAAIMPIVVCLTLLAYSYFGAQGFDAFSTGTKSLIRVLDLLFGAF